MGQWASQRWVLGGMSVHSPHSAASQDAPSVLILELPCGHCCLKIFSFKLKIPVAQNHPDVMNQVKIWFNTCLQTEHCGQEGRGWKFLQDGKGSQWPKAVIHPGSKGQRDDTSQGRDVTQNFRGSSWGALFSPGNEVIETGITFLSILILNIFLPLTFASVWDWIVSALLPRFVSTCSLRRLDLVWK